MKNVWVRNKTSRFNPASKVLLGTLALVVTVGFGVTVHTTARVAPDSTDSKADESLSTEMGFFDPFAPNTIRGVAQSSLETGVLRDAKTQPPIRIPSRPALRTPIRPPLVQR